MVLRNDEYWKRRAEQLEDALNAKNRQTYAELERIFDRAIRDIDKAIRRWYTRYLVNNDDINLAEAKRRLAKRELEEFKWDVQEYIRKGRENGVSADWEKQLENASARVPISRLEALKMELQQYIEEVYGQEQTAVQRHLEDTYRDTYYHQAFEIYQGIGVGWTFAEIDEDYLAKVLAKPWAPDRYNFSQRIWKNKDKLLSNAHQIISRHLILGSDPQKPIDELAQVMGVSKRNAGRLVMTESAYFAGEARKDCFNALGVERYKIIATLDLKTSAICREMDGKVFRQSEYEAGTTAPPFHPNCRTTTAPYYEDMEGLGERAARDPETGKTYRVPASMTYNEWYEKYVGSVESERTGKHDRRDHPEIKVNKQAINRPDYRSKFDKLTDNEVLNQNLYKSAKEILKHRDGTFQEDLYLLHKETGQVLYKNTTSTVKQGVAYTDAMRKLVKRYPNQLVTLHNYPQSMPPSGDDIHTQQIKGYAMGVVVGHDGKVFKYKINENTKPFTVMQYKMAVAKHKAKGYNEAEAQARALQDLSKDYHFDFEEVNF